MNRIFIAIVLSLAAVSLACAQNPIPERLLISTGQDVGPGARPLGLGGTYTGIGDDYSTIWWNPAGLAQVKRIELQGGLARSGFGDKTTYFGGNESGSTNTLRLNNAGVVFPVPVYQGALTFAFGYNQLAAFDRRTRVQAPTPDVAHYWDDFDELNSGRLGQWAFAAATDVSPDLSLGMGLQYWSGASDYSRTGHYTASDSTGIHPGVYSESINTDLSGWGANFGALFHAGRYARIGAMFQTPVSLKHSEDHDINGDVGSFDYRLTYPYALRLGASFSPGRWLLASDVEYRDWTTMQFHSDTPYDGVSQADANQQIKNTYKGTLRFSAGGEYLFPQYGLRARAGYAYEPANFIHTDNQNLISFGLGLLVEKNVMIDAGVMFSAFKQTSSDGAPNGFYSAGIPANIISESANANTALLTISYRM